MGERVLLLPHCLRPSEDCPGKVTRDGLQCPQDCTHRGECAIGRLRDEAERLGYKGICVAPGGAMALRFVKETAPKGILAIACHKELLEGVQAVEEAPAEEKPVILTLPLLRDGCVDTLVDVDEALRRLKLGTE
jgi:hypothetical protein